MTLEEQIRAIARQEALKVMMEARPAPTPASIRLHAGFRNVADLALISDVHAGTIRRYEHGTWGYSRVQTLANWEKIARACKVSFADYASACEAARRSS